MHAAIASRLPCSGIKITDIPYRSQTLNKHERYWRSRDVIGHETIIIRSGWFPVSGYLNGMIARADIFSVAALWVMSL